MNIKGKYKNKTRIRRIFKTMLSAYLTFLIGICFVFPVYADSNQLSNIITQVAEGRFGSVQYEFGTESVTGLSLPLYIGYGYYRNGDGSVAVLGPIDATGKDAIKNRLVDYSKTTGVTTTPMSGGEVRQYTMSDGNILQVILDEYIIVVELRESGDTVNVDFSAATNYAQQVLDGLENNGLLSRPAQDIASVISGAESQSDWNTDGSSGKTNTKGVMEEPPVAIGSVGNIPGPANNTEAVVGVVVPGLLVTLLGAFAGLAGGGFTPSSGSGITPTGGPSTTSTEPLLKSYVSRKPVDDSTASELQPAAPTDTGQSGKMDVIKETYGENVPIDTAVTEEIDLVLKGREIGITPLDEILITPEDQDIVIDTSALEGLNEVISKGDILTTPAGQDTVIDTAAFDGVIDETPQDETLVSPDEVSIDKEYDANGFDKDGYNSEGFNKQGFDRTGYGKNGFNSEGFDSEGYDINGYNAQGYNQNGFDAQGFNKAGYDKAGFNKDRIDKEGYNSEGFNKQGFDRTGYDVEGYDKDGLNRDGFDRNGKNQSGYDEYGYDVKGFNKDGFDKDGYDLEGFDYKGYNREGYDPWGYDRQGYGKDGYHWSGYNRDGNDRNGKSWDDLGYDPNHRNPFDGGPIILDGSAEVDTTPKKPPLGEPYPKTAEKYGPKPWNTPATPDDSGLKVSETDSGVIGPEDPMNTLNQHPLGEKNVATDQSKSGTPEAGSSSVNQNPSNDKGTIRVTQEVSTAGDPDVIVPPPPEEPVTAVTPETPVTPPEPESMVVTTSANGAQTLIIKDPVTGQWVDSENGAIFDLEKHKQDFPQQVKDYQDYIQHNADLERSGQTAMQQALDKIAKDAKAEIDSIQNEIDKRNMEQLKWDQQQAIWDQQQAEKATGWGSIIAHTAANAGEEIVQTAADIKEGAGIVVDTLKNIKDGGLEGAAQNIKDAYEGTIKEGVDLAADTLINIKNSGFEGAAQNIQDAYEGTKQVIQTGLKDTAEAATYIYENPEKAWEKAKAAGKAVSIMLKDAKLSEKAWDFVKDSVGIDNFGNSLDPNRSLASRIGQVLIGTGKVGLTILTLGQAGSALKSGASKLSGLADDVLGAGGKSLAGKTAIKTGLGKAIPTSIEEAFVNSKGVPNLTGLTKTSQKIIQEKVGAWNVQLVARSGKNTPTMVTQMLESGGAVSKAVITKPKTARLLDGLLGGPKDIEGLVVHYNPKLPPKEVWNNLSLKTREELVSLYKERRRDFKKLAKNILQHVNAKEIEVLESGPLKGLVKQYTGTKGGKLIFKPIAGDIDILDVLNVDSTALNPKYKKEVIKAFTEITGSNINHEDVISWAPDCPTGYSLKAKAKMINDAMKDGKGVTIFRPNAKPTASYLRGTPIDTTTLKNDGELMGQVAKGVRESVKMDKLK